MRRVLDEIRNAFGSRRGGASRSGPTPPRGDVPTTGIPC
jgi:hypothetical protein